jgi:hypothetical protein
MSKLFALCAAAAVALAVGLSSTPSAAQGQQCGGFAGFPCNEGYVCRYPPHCVDCFGVCVPAPKARHHSPRQDREDHKDHK